MRFEWPEPRTLILAGAGVLVVAALALGGWYWHDNQQHRVRTADDREGG